MSRRNPYLWRRTVGARRVLTPADILQGIAFVLDPADAVVSSGAVETFRNAGGTPITQSDAAKRATFTASDSDFGGRPSATFACSVDGTTSFNEYDIPGGLLAAITTAAEVFAVLKSTYGTATVDARVGLWSLGSSNVCYPYTDGYIYDCVFANARPQYPDSLGLSLTQPHIYNVRTSAAGMTATNNGSVIYDNAGVVFTPAASAVVGSSAANQHFNGKLAYLVICNEVQTPGARARMLNYLASRFGITLPESP